MLCLYLLPLQRQADEAHPGCLEESALKSGYIGDAEVLGLFAQKPGKESHGSGLTGDAHIAAGLFFEWLGLAAVACM